MSPWVFSMEQCKRISVIACWVLSIINPVHVWRDRNAATIAKTNQVNLLITCILSMRGVKHLGVKLAERIWWDLPRILYVCEPVETSFWLFLVYFINLYLELYFYWSWVLVELCFLLYLSSFNFGAYIYRK